MPSLSPEPSEQVPTRPQIRHLALQFAAAFAVVALAWPYYGLRNQQLPWPQTAFAIGAIAMLLASLTRQPWWWRVIHALFVPMAWAVSRLEIDPSWFLLLCVLLLLVYRGALTGQIPLYLSNRASTAALAGLIADRRDQHFLDLGAGIGSVVIALARERPDTQFTGVENAPASWLVGRLRSARLANCNWRWGDLWRSDLACYDLVYAFLSPAPMAALWVKVQQEMRPGSLFVSNSFAVPDVQASGVIEVDDARQTRLYCYRI